MLWPLKLAILLILVFTKVSILSGCFFFFKVWSPLLGASECTNWLLLLLFMLKDIKMRFVIRVGINYFTSGGLRSGQIQHSLMQESLGQKLCNSHLPLQNNCPCEPSTFKKEREELLQHYILLKVSFFKKKKMCCYKSWINEWNVRRGRLWGTNKQQLRQHWPSC